MDSKKITRAEMIRRLAEIIEKETSKDFEDMDYDLVAECGELLDRLMGKRRRLSEREIRKKINLIKARVDPELKKTLRRRKLMKVLITAAAVMCMSVTVIAIPFTRNYILNALQLGNGESSEMGGISCVNNGIAKDYDTIEEFVKNNNLSFSYPRGLSGKYKIEKIICVNESDLVFLFFKDENIDYEIWLNNTDISIYTPHATEYHYGNYTTYVVADNKENPTKYYSYTVVGDDIHSITSSDISDIEVIISSIE